MVLDDHAKSNAQILAGAFLVDVKGEKVLMHVREGRPKGVDQIPVGHGFTALGEQGQNFGAKVNGCHCRIVA